MIKKRLFIEEDQRHITKKKTLPGYWQTMFHESCTFLAHIMNKGTDGICTVLSFQRWLYSKQLVREMVL